MTREECDAMLARTRLARLACAQGSQPYVLPMHVAYDAAARSLYAFTFAGLKVEWMRANPRVCVEVDEILADDRWTSLIGFGRYEELAQSACGAPRCRLPERTMDGREDGDDGDSAPDERDRAWQLLENIHPVWFDPACTAWAARLHRHASEAIVPIYFKIRLDRVTGHQATPDTEGAIVQAAPGMVAGRWARLRGMLERVYPRERAAPRRLRTVTPSGPR